MDPQSSQPVCGFLKKKGQGTSLLGRRSWKKRFFVLDGPYFMWYENEYVHANGLPPLGALILCPDSTKCSIQLSSTKEPTKEATDSQNTDSKSSLQSSSESSYSSSSSFSSEEGSKDQENQRDDSKTNSASNSKKNSRRKYGFEVVTIGRTLYLESSSEEDRRHWMEELTKHKYTTPKPLPFL